MNLDLQLELEKYEAAYKSTVERIVACCGDDRPDLIWLKEAIPAAHHMLIVEMERSIQRAVGLPMPLFNSLLNLYWAQHYYFVELYRAHLSGVQLPVTPQVIQ